MQNKNSTSASRIPLLTTGLSGLVGSTFRDAFETKYDFTNLDISHPENPVDITNYNQVSAAIQNHPAESIIHLAAFTDVTAAYEQKDDTSGLAYRVNVTGTEHIAQAAKESGKHLIHISTAFVFDGTKETLYSESDATNPIEWYGYTKAKAEEAVAAICDPQLWSILRIDFPFRSSPSPRPDIVRKNIQAMEKGYPLFTDHFFGPTFLDDFAKILDWAVSDSSASTGMYHASSGEKWSDFELAQALIKAQNLPYTAKPGSLDEYLKTLQRPYQRNTAMSADKIKKVLPFQMVSIDTALKDYISLT